MNPKALELEAAISAYSEDRFSAGWHMGVEFVLWKEVCEYRACLQSKAVVEMLLVSPTRDVLDAISHLAQQAGGWWHWAENAPGATFLTADVWAKIYAEWNKR